MRTGFFVLLLAGMIPVVACQSQSEQSSGPPDASASQSATRPLDSVNVAEAAARLYQEAENASSWREAAHTLSSTLEEPSPVPLALREKAAASAMLSVHFEAVEPNPSPDKQAVLSHYTDLYLSHGPSKSPLLRPALETLRGHWSDQRLAAAIDTVLRTSRERYRVHPAGVEPHIPDVHADIRRANDSLRALRAALTP